MTLLIDHLRRDGASIYFQPLLVESIGRDAIESFAKWTQAAILEPRLPVFEASNVSAFYQEVADRGGTWDDVAPAVSIPFLAFWVEYKDPIAGGITGHIVTFTNTEYRNVHVVSMASDSDGSQVYAMQAFHVSDDGTWDFGSIGHYVHCQEQAEKADYRARIGEREEASRQSLGPLVATLAFLNCKNVTVTDNEGKHASRQERRAAERRNDPPLVTYKTLQIEPMKKVLATEGDIAKNGLAKALHICRGHFAEYGGESGKGKLFGKYEGRFYIPAHVRGSAEVGVVHKRYNVKAPKAGAA